LKESWLFAVGRTR